MDFLSSAELDSGQLHTWSATGLWVPEEIVPMVPWTSWRTLGQSWWGTKSWKTYRWPPGDCQRWWRRPPRLTRLVDWAERASVSEPSAETLFHARLYPFSDLREDRLWLAWSCWDQWFWISCCQMWVVMGPDVRCCRPRGWSVGLIPLGLQEPSPRSTGSTCTVLFHRDVGTEHPH